MCRLALRKLPPPGDSHSIRKFSDRRFGKSEQVYIWSRVQLSAGVFLSDVRKRASVMAPYVSSWHFSEVRLEESALGLEVESGLGSRQSFASCLQAAYWRKQFDTLTAQAEEVRTLSPAEFLSGA